MRDEYARKEAHVVAEYAREEAAKEEAAKQEAATQEAAKEEGNAHEKAPVTFLAAGGAAPKNSSGSEDERKQRLSARARKDLEDELARLRKKARHEEYYAGLDGRKELSEMRDEYARKEAHVVAEYAREEAAKEEA